MKYYRKSITLILALLLMTLFGACSSKKNKTETNVTTDSHVTVEQNTTTGGGIDNNTTTTPTVTLKSLNLTVDKTALNKDENATVKVMAAYSDNSTKEVTDKVEWVVVPNNTIKVTNATLTALQDKATTLKAKLKGKTSNAIDLNITWTVNGHTLPPEPDKAVNDATLLGIDTNNNGVRDDVERWIYDRYKDSHPVMIPLKMQAARAYQKIIVDPSKAKETYHIMDDQMNCSDAFGSWANAFGRKPLFDKDSETEIKEMREMKYIPYNTAQRARAYGQYNQTLSGMVFRGEWPSEKWIENCDFNTTKFIEMSEKL